MTLICNESDMQKLLTEIGAGCLNDHDLTRIVEALPEAFRDQIADRVLEQLKQALESDQELVVHLGHLTISGGQLVLHASGGTRSQVWDLSSPSVALRGFFEWHEVNVEQRRAKLAARLTHAQDDLALFKHRTDQVMLEIEQISKMLAACERSHDPSPPAHTTSHELFQNSNGVTFGETNGRPR